MKKEILYYSGMQEVRSVQRVMRDSLYSACYQSINQSINQSISQLIRFIAHKTAYNRWN